MSDLTVHILWSYDDGLVGCFYSRDSAINLARDILHGCGADPDEWDVYYIIDEAKVE